MTKVSAKKAMTNIESIYPLSPMQEGMLFHSLYSPDSGVYFEQLICTLRGDLEVVAFERAWQRVVDRYPTLRTAFIVGNAKEPVQIVHRHVETTVSVQDLEHLTPSQAEDRLETFVKDEQSLGVELNKAPLMRLTLLRKAPDLHFFVWSYHHLLLDGWSVPIVLQEVMLFYEAFRKNRDVSLPLRRPYRDYIAWITSQDPMKAETFWRDLLGDLTSPTLLTQGNLRANVHVSEDTYGDQELWLDAGETEAFQAFSRRYQITPSTMVQGAWSLVLSRYNGEDDVTFGATVSGRPAGLKDVESMVGLFINTLPMRVRTSSDAQVRFFLKDIQAQALELRQYEYCSLVKIQELSSVPRGVPLFESILVYENYPISDALMHFEGSIQVQDVRSFSQTNYPLTVVSGLGHLLMLKIIFNRGIFDEATIGRMLTHIKNAVVSFTEFPERALRDLSIFTRQEEQELLVQWNRTSMEYPRDRCVHELFEMRVKETPEALALLFEEERLTYSELNRRATLLAHRLKDLGVGPEILVGISTERSPDMIVGILGVLKAGGAYLPLDPNYPPDRLSFMVEDSRIRILLTQSHLVDRFPYSTEQVCSTIRLDSDLGEFPEAILDEPVRGPDPDNLAYVIYTSGSTGKPKGTMLIHRGLTNLTTVQREAFGIGEGSRVLQFSPFSFDASVWETFMALANGGTLCLARQEILASGDELAELIRDCGVTNVTLPPSVARVLPVENLPNLRTLISAGEPCTEELVDRWAGGRQVFNAYGPTETTVCASMRQCRARERGAPPIGRPIGNGQVYVLDGNLQPVPAEVSGELYVGGVSLARGYLNRPDLTAERFVPDPFGEAPGGRLYRTGDLVRWLSNGELEFLGRIDHQVKVRGFRIELGEIETVLNRHPAVGQAVVTARADESGEKFLAAYVVLEKGTEPDARELRDYLKERLPSHMVPSTFTVLTEFPLTPSGKVDRKALPEPGGMLGVKGYVAPRTPIEGVLSEIWAKVLGVERVGVEDNFYDLGGHSLKATQLISRVQKAFGVEIPLRDLFETLTTSGLAERVEAALKGVSGLVVPPIERVSREGDLPLSFAQERLWFLDQLAPENLFYNIPLAVRLKGALDVGVLEESLKAVTDRHEVLRTHFAAVDGRPVQMIEPELYLPLTVEDLSGLTEGEREAHATGLLTEEVRKPFDLTNGPLLRARLLKLSEEDHIVLLVIHHIVTDGWSMGVMIEELGALYPAFLQGSPSPLPAMAVQYADFAHWQREWLQGEVLERHLAYWREQLRGSPPMLDLPTDRPRKAIQSAKGAIYSFRLSREISEPLRKLSREQGVTMFMALLGVFQVLLYRYTGQEEINVGIPIANRNRREIEGLMGFFVNTLVIRGDLSGEPGFKEVLRRVREAALGAYTHQDLPFEVLVEALQPKRDLSHTPLFQVMFTMDPPTPQGFALPGLTLTPVEVYRGAATFDLTLSMREGEDGLSGYVEYNTDLFDEATIERMLGHYEQLLEGMAADPDQSVGTLPLLTEGEQERILRTWNNTEMQTPTDRCVHELFEARAEQRPEAPAVIFEEQILSYRELNRRSNQLAHYLLKLGVGPEMLVGISTERSPEMIVGILGVLKAGGAYLPLDTSYPPERLSFMVEDSQVKVLLTQEHLLDRLPDQCTRICLDSEWDRIAKESGEHVQSRITPDHLAYVIYTSGSTGKPKGTEIEHRGLLNLLFWHQKAFAVSSADRATQIAAPGFDASVWEIWPYLAAGASIHMPVDEIRTIPSKLKDWLLANGITICFLPTPLAESIISLDWPHNSSLRKLLTGGDRLHSNSTVRLPFELINNYGPTENTVVTTSCPVPKSDGSETNPSIGRPISNNQVYILDRYLNPVPVGVLGELHISGSSLARSYLKRPQLSAEKFIPNPFSDDAGSRLYKTGDLVRYLPDGSIEFVGRMDHQVKVRGFRIELGEIEAALDEHPAVQKAVVLPWADDHNDTRLTAYIVEKGEPTSEEWRAYLKRKLPEYMIPSTFVHMEDLPLSVGGKLDRGSLPAPDCAEIKDQYCAPTTPEEEILAHIWAELFGADRVGIHDNFFELGGHSLLATQVISRVRETFHVELPVKTLFEYPTLAGLASRVKSAILEKSDLLGLPIRPVPRDQDVPLSFAQQRLWFLDQLNPGSSVYNIPSAVRLTGHLDLHALERCLNEVVRRHESLRTSFRSVKGKAVQIIASELRIPLEVVDLSNLQENDCMKEALRLVSEEAQRSFDLSQGPLLRASVLRLAHEDHIIMINMHHIISDGWSSDNLLKEIASIYDAFMKGQPSPLQELPIQYADFALWQRQFLCGEHLEAQITYWKQKLKGIPPLLKWPTDRPRPPVQTYNGNRCALSLSGDLSERVKHLSKQESVTLFMTLLAVFQTLLYRYTGQEDICVGTPIANRNRAETEELIGFFVNTLVLRATVSGDDTFRELLRQVRETALEAYAHQDLPFEKIVDALEPQRDLSHSPIFQVMFTLQTAPLEIMRFPDLTFSPLVSESSTSKFDLSMFISDEGDGLSGVVEYNTDLFDRTTVERMVRHFEMMAEEIVDHPDALISALPLLTSQEHSQMMVEWNATSAELRQDSRVHELFEFQALQSPESVAVAWGGGKWNYGELNRKANRLANYLLKQGVGPEKAVGVCMHRSPELVMAQLAILKAGGAFVPIDPTYPPERFSFILEDSRILLLITLSQQCNDLFGGAIHAPCSILCLDKIRETLRMEMEENPQVTVGEANLAYIIYTSGSTGWPKGVGIEQKSLLNLVSWHQRTFSVSEKDRATLIAGPGFDASVWEIWPYLTSGAALHIPDEETRALPLQLKDWFVSEGITIGFLPTPVAENIMDLTWPGQSSLRILLTGGDKLNRHPSASAPFQLVNNYGPTENAVVTTSCLISPEMDQELPPSIGRPIDNSRVYLLDGHMNPVPPGITGELHIGGIGLARGYLNRPDLTAERFIPDPFSNESGARLYRTGDLVRYRSDANIDFIGRIDHQVKIRGFRIELGEIENALSRHPDLQEAVVMVREDVPGGKKLVGYVVPKKEPPAISDLSRFLKWKLPDYMVPSAFVMLDALPLTPSGKVDRSVLPVPDTGRPGLEVAYEAPRSLKEKAMARIWSQVLGVERVGIYDNFFDLGGDSILSIQVIARAKEEGINLTPRQFFESPTISDLLALEPVTTATQFEQGLVEGQIPLTPIQHFFFESFRVNPHHFNTSMVLEIPGGLLSPQLLEKSFNHLISHHDALRIRFRATERGWEQINVGEASVPFSYLDFSALEPDEQRKAIESTGSKLQASFDISKEPLIRLAYFDCGEKASHRLLIIFHHLITDGVSWRIVLEDLQTIYGQLNAGESVKLPPKTLSYRQWAITLHEYAKSPELRSEMSYWKRLAEKRVLPLPTDYPCGIKTFRAMNYLYRSLTPDETEGLLQKAPAAYGSYIKEVLITAFVRAFCSWTGRRELYLEMEGHGREDIMKEVDVSRTVGWFTTVFPVHLTIKGSDEPQDDLYLIRDQLRSIPRNGIGYGVLRYLTKDDEITRTLDDLPVPEVNFNYLGQFGPFAKSLPSDPAEAVYAASRRQIRISREPIGPEQSPDDSPTSSLYFVGTVSGGQFNTRWLYVESLYELATVERLADLFISELQKLILPFVVIPERRARNL